MGEQWRSPTSPTKQPWFGQLRRALLDDRRLHIALSTSGIMALLVIGIRFPGFLQPVELWAFDQLLRSRGDESRDERLLIIEVDQDPNPQNTGVALSDKTLLELLTTLDSYQPKVIGLDIYRKSVVATTYQPTLGERLKTDSRLITVCKVPDPKDNLDPNGVIAPPEIPKQQLQQRVGFSDFVPDPGKVVRRQLLEMSLSIREPPCLTPYAFSFRLAASYLDTEPIIPSTTYTLKGVEFPPIEDRTSGYQGVDAGGHQILLNYRRVQGSPRNIAETVTLQNFLKRDVPFQTLKDRIVLIGVTAADKGDDWRTPYQEEIPGVMIQAQMTSQLLSAVSGERPLLWVWSQPQEWLWIVGWSIAGGLAVWRFRRVSCLSLAVGGGLSILLLVCFGALAVWGGWLPLVPPALALGVSAIAVRIITYTEERF